MVIASSPSVVAESLLQKQDSLCKGELFGTSIDGRRKHRQMLTRRNDALTYLNAVKETFHDNTQTHDDFLNVMKDFKARRIDVAVVRKRVKQLFRDHPKLIFGFNAFLPRGYEIFHPLNQDPTQTKQPLGLDESIKYVMKIKTQFEGNNDHVYKSFVDIMTAFKEGSTSTLDLFEEVSLLFKDHVDLMVEFFSFVRITEDEKDGGTERKVFL